MNLGEQWAYAAPVAAAVTIRGVEVADIPAILELHREAFAEKFHGAFGPTRVGQGTEALATAWRRQGAQALRGMFLAQYQQHVVGTITLRTWEMVGDDAGITEYAFQEALGLWGATRSMFVLSLLSHRIGRDEGFITDVAVVPDFRRQGLGQTLLAHAEAVARQRGKTQLGLYVSSTNTAATSLYEQNGFTVARVRRSWLTRCFFGQRDWLYMSKALRQ